ncbi:MAG: nitrilase-related carbon-nitrogen hydrolase [Desulfosalsimonas sp.]
MSNVKISVCQLELRDTLSFGEMEDRLADICRRAIKQGPDIIMFPEFTALGLLAMAGPDLKYSDMGRAMRDTVSAFTPNYQGLFRELSKESGCVIHGGSHWIYEEDAGTAYNVACLFFPDGRMEIQKKNHLFPGEIDWGTSTYDRLTPFDTPKVNVGLMTCYDAEFPEVARHFLLEGADLLMCPSATYTIRGYYRIRRCCAARAVENQVYVAEGHQVGALSVPVDRPFTAYGFSAVLCPIDEQTGVASGVLAEAPTAEHETVLTAEMDMDALARSRKSSEATILKDRRPDTYSRYYKIL